MKRGSQSAAVATQGIPSTLAAGYWRYSWILASVLLVVISIRTVELVPGMAAVRPAIVSVGLLFPILLLRSREIATRTVFRSPSLKLLLLYCAWACIGVPFALYRSAALGGAQTLVFGTIVVVALVLVPPTRAMLDRLALIFLAAVGATAALGLAQGIDAGGRLSTAGAYDPNDFASLLAIAMPFGVAMILRKRGIERWAALAITAILVTTLLATGSRGGMVGLAAGMLVFLAALPIRRALTVLALITVIAPVVWNYAPPVFRERMLTFVELESDYNVHEDYGRLATWKRGIQYSLTYPVTGVGAANFGVAEGERLRSLNRPGFWFTAHNMYVQSFAEFGIPGGALFMIILGYSALVC